MIAFQNGYLEVMKILIEEGNANRKTTLDFEKTQLLQDKHLPLMQYLKGILICFQNESLTCYL